MIGSLHPTIAADLAKARQRDLLDGAARRRRADRASGSLRNWIGQVIVGWGVRIAPEVRPRICSEVS